MLSKYDPFGDIEASKGTSDNKFNFTGKETDEESGLIYFGARYYNPLIGRWISKDFVEGLIASPQSLNKYVYVKNNPLSYIDPNGLLDVAVAALGYYAHGNDDNAFVARALSIKYGNPIKAFSGRSLVQQLSMAFKTANDPIKNMTIFGHSSPNGILMSEWSGLYNTEDSRHKSEAGYISDIKTSIANGDLSFDPSGVITLAGCNLGSEGFAKSLAETTGMSVIAAQGAVSPVVKNGKETGMFTADKGWVKFGPKGTIEKLGRTIPIIPNQGNSQSGNGSSSGSLLPNQTSQQNTSPRN